MAVHLSLVHEAPLIAMDEFDRVLDQDDVSRLLEVDHVDERSQVRLLYRLFLCAVPRRAVDSSKQYYGNVLIRGQSKKLYKSYTFFIKLSKLDHFCVSN